MNSEDKIEDLKSQILQHQNIKIIDSLRDEGIEYNVSYGVIIPELKDISKPYKGDHELALRLFQEDIRECKIIASMIDDPEKVTGDQIDEWSNDFINTEIVDQVCSNLFWKSPYALSRSIEWCIQGDPLYQKAGLIIIGRRASDSLLNDAIFEPYPGIIENMAETDEELIRNTALFALREIAKRGPKLEEKVISSAERMTVSDFEVASWIGNQLLFEFSEE